MVTPSTESGGAEEEPVNDGDDGGLVWDITSLRCKLENNAVKHTCV